MVSIHSIKTKLVLIIALILSLTVVVTLNISNQLVGEYHQKTQRENLNRAWNLFNSMLTNIKTNSRNKTELISVLPILATVVENKDLSTIQDIASEYQNQLNFDFFEIYNLEGDRLQSLAPENASSPIIQAMVEECLDNEDLYLSFVNLQGVLYFITASPIGVKEDPSGALVVGAAIDNKFIAQVKKQADVNIAIVQHFHHFKSK